MNLANLKVLCLQLKKQVHQIHLELGIESLDDYAIGMVPLHDRTGQRVRQVTGDGVILVRDLDRLTPYRRNHFCREVSTNS